MIFDRVQHRRDQPLFVLSSNWRWQRFKSLKQSWSGPASTVRTERLRKPHARTCLCKPWKLFGPEAAWRNKLIWGDNLLVMGSLLEEFAGKIDLIYIDPPFATGADFAFPAAIGQQEMAYRDTWNVSTGSYLAMMAERLQLIRELLSPTGSLFLHCDWHVSHLLRTIGDEVFGAEQLSQRNRVVLLQQISRQRETLCVQSRCCALVSQECVLPVQSAN